MKKRVLDRGFVTLVDTMGDDRTIVRSSHAHSEISDEKSKKLLRFLWNNRLTGPFEHVTFQFHVRVPIFVARQWMKHQQASYSEVTDKQASIDDDFYSPAEFQTQGENYKLTNLPPETTNELHLKFQRFYQATHNFYKKLLSNYNLSKSQARMLLPQGMYTEFYFTVNASSLMDFLKTHLSTQAQWEIRQYAEAMFEILKARLPWTAEAFIRKDLI